MPQFDFTSRPAVYAALDSERNYQDVRWNRPIRQHEHSFEEWIMYMEDYLAEAKHILSRSSAIDSREPIAHIIRKVTAMGVACMEEHGAPRREGY